MTLIKKKMDSPLRVQKSATNTRDSTLWEPSWRLKCCPSWVAIAPKNVQRWRKCYMSKLDFFSLNRYNNNCFKTTQPKRLRLTYEGFRRLRNDEGDSFILTMGLKLGELIMPATKGDEFREFFGAAFCGMRNLKLSDLFDMFGELVIRMLLFNVTFGDTKSGKNSSDNHKSNFIELLPSTHIFRLAPWSRLKVEVSRSLRNTFKSEIN